MDSLLMTKTNYKDKMMKLMPREWQHPHKTDASFNSAFIKYAEKVKSEEENFKKIIEDSQNELYSPYYDFSYKYVDLPIWTDLTHVAADNEKSLTYTDDVLKIIFEEINH